MSQHGDEEPIRVSRIDDDVRDLLAVAEAEMRPRPAGVGRLVNPVADRQVGPREPFAAPDVHDVGIGRRDGDRSDRAGGLVVEDRRPRAAEVGCLPHAAVHRADVEDVRVARDAGNRLGASAAERSDGAPAHLGGERLEVVDLRLRRILRRKGQCHREKAETSDCRTRWFHLAPPAIQGAS